SCRLAWKSGQRALGCAAPTPRTCSLVVQYIVLYHNNVNRQTGRRDAPFQHLASFSGGVGAGLDRIEHLDQQPAFRRAQAGCDSGLVDRIRLSEFPHQRLATLGQVQGAGTLVVRRRSTPCQAPMLELIQQAHEIRTSDADRLANMLLLQARVTLDDGQDAVLYRANVESGKGPHEVAKNRQLRLSERISYELRKMTEIDRRRRRTRRLAGAPGSFRFLCHRPDWPILILVSDRPS